MSTPLAYWCALSASGVACALALAAPRWLPFPPKDDPALTSLVAEQARLASASDATRDELRKRRSSRNDRGWTQADLAVFRGALGSEWGWEKGPTTARASSFVLSQNEASFTIWPSLLRIVRTIESQPTLVLSELEITASSPRALRVRLTVRLPLLQELTAATTAGPRPAISATSADTERRQTN